MLSTPQPSPNPLALKPDSTPICDFDPTESPTVVTVSSTDSDCSIESRCDLVCNGVTSIEFFPSDTVLVNSVSTDIALAPPYVYDDEDPDPSFDRDNPLLPSIFDTLVDTYPSNDAPDTSAFRAQIDTGAGASCTNLKRALHDYRPYSHKYPSPITLTAALGMTVVPEGEGYLRLPAPNGTYVDVLTYYSPLLTSTLVSEQCILKSSKFPIKEYGGQWIRKFYHSDDCETGNITVLCQHKISPSKNIVVHGVLLLGQCFSHPLIMPDSDTSCTTTADPKALNSLQIAKHSDPEFAKACSDGVIANIEWYKNNVHELLTNNLKSVPQVWVNSIDFHALVENSITPHSAPIQAIKARTEKLLWHQRLGHPCDAYLYDAHKHIQGVPKFSKITTVLDQCPTCIQSKQTKAAPGHNSTQVATQPYQGLSIDFSFSGMKSKNNDRRSNFEGINGETAWIRCS